MHKIEKNIDLFEHTELLPPKVLAIIQAFEGETYEDCRRLEAELLPLGYAFDYYLDAFPYNLHKINP